MTDLINDRTKPDAENPLVLRTMKPDSLASDSSWPSKEFTGSASAEKTLLLTCQCLPSRSACQS